MSGHESCRDFLDKINAGDRSKRAKARRVHEYCFHSTSLHEPDFTDDT